MKQEMYKLTVTVLSDLHTGSGLGGADIDALLERDGRDLPTVRWTHLHGLLVQALTDRQRALVEDSSKLLFELFGVGESPGRGVVRGISLRVPSGKPAESKVYASSARQPGSRVPADDTLRRIEYLAAGTVLEGLIQVPAGFKLAGGDEGVTAAKLLETLLRRLDRLGKNRTKGDGRILMKWDPYECSNDGSIKGEAGPCDDGWQYYRVAIRSLDPVCLGATSSPGNLIPGASHISPLGSFGLLAAAALRDDDHVKDLFFDGSVEVGAFYPIGRTGGFDACLTEALPYPLYLQSPKPAAQEDEWPWWIEADTAPQAHDVLLSRPAEKLKRPGAHAYLVTRDGGKTWQREEIHLRIRLRNNAGDVQAKRRAEKALFSQEEVGEEVAFISTLRVRASDPTKAKRFEDWLGQYIAREAWLFAGRGGTPMRIEQAARITRPMSDEPADGKAIRLFIETDLIARRGAQRFFTQLDAACLQALFAQTELEGFLQSIQKVEHLSETTVAHGFNAMTGQKRLPAIAIRRGSGALLTMRSEADAKLLRGELIKRQMEGLGERCAEGYGRFRVDFVPRLSAPSRGPDQALVPSDDEVLLHGVQSMLDKYQHLLQPETGFSATRLQGLRHAVRNPQAFDEWKSAAERAIRATKDLQAQALLDEICRAYDSATKAGGPDGEAPRPDVRHLLERFAIEAAKHVQREARIKKRVAG